MRSRDVPMINTQPTWAQPRTNMRPVRASPNTALVHTPGSHGRTLPGGHAGVHHSYRSLRFDPGGPIAGVLFTVVEHPPTVPRTPASRGASARRSGTSWSVGSVRPGRWSFSRTSRFNLPRFSLSGLRRPSPQPSPNGRGSSRRVTGCFSRDPGAYAFTGEGAGVSEIEVHDA